MKIKAKMGMDILQYETKQNDEETVKPKRDFMI